MRVYLVTGRSLGQGTGKEKGKFSQVYLQNTSQCEIDPDDLRELNLHPDENLLVKTEFGSVVVKPVASKQAPHRGIVFVSYGPRVNRVTNPETHGSGMPSLKGIVAEISPTREPVTEL